MVARLTVLTAVVTIAYGALLFHLYTLQLQKGEYFLARAESQYISPTALKAERGAIYFEDKNGNRLPAAINKKFSVIYAVPKVIDDAQETANAVAPILKLKVSDLEKKFSKKDDAYEALVKKADSAMVASVNDLKLKGIYVEAVPERFYPFGKFAAHVLGYFGPNKNDAGESGFYGLEQFYNEELTGRVGEVNEGEIVEPVAGDNIITTIDPNIQTQAERIIEDLVVKFKATGGSVVVEDPKTGKILTMASVPEFDPNTYAKSPLKSFLNPAAQELYEPGSVFKIITMAAGIDAGKITPETTFFDSGVLMVSGKKIQNWDHKGHGTITMTNVIEKSVNTGAAFAERETGHTIFKNYLHKFGFGEKTGIDLPGEVKGDLRNLHETAPAVAFATASFGQGVAVTSLEMINAFAAIANGGKLMRPYLNAEFSSKEVRRVISPATAKAVTQMMISAVDKAEVAKINGYTIAGKTGTAQVPDLTRGGYTDRVINTYIGFGPTEDPRFVILIKLNEAEGAPLAGISVVPAFRELAEFILNYYAVSPDRLVEP